MRRSFKVFEQFLGCRAYEKWASLVAQMVNNSMRDLTLIPGLGRSSGKGNSILARKIPWPEEPGRLQSMGLQRAGHN